VVWPMSASFTLSGGHTWSASAPGSVEVRLPSL
jgi:hypothetical protein